jgi:PAS domain S-box-containing protein
MMREQRLSEILTPGVIGVSAAETVSKAIGIMRSRNISCIVILEKNKPVGIFTERNVVNFVARHGFGFDNREIKDLMTSPVLTATKDTGIFTAYNLLVSNKIRHLVVVDDKNHSVGVVTQSNIIKHLGYEYFIEVKKISEIMSKSVITISKDTTARQALTEMADKSVSCLVIADNNCPAGILTERDIAQLLIDHHDIRRMKVEELMSHPVQTILWNTPVHEATKIMKQRKIRRLVVVNKNGEITGLVTQSDIIRGLEGKYIDTLKQIIKEKDLQIENTLRDLMEKSIYLDNILRSSMDVGIAATDINFHIAYFNTVAEEIFGCKAEEVIGRNAKEIHIQKNIESFRFDRAVETIRNKKNHIFTFEKEGKEGKQLIQARVSGIWDKERNLVGFVLMLHDVTERKKMEEELLKAQKLESTGTLAGGIAHDFNNLLTAILGNISLAQIHLKPGDKIFKMLSKAEKSCMKAKNLTQQLITFAKGEAPVKKTESLQSVVKDAVNYALSGSNVKCQFDVPEDLWPVNCDEGQIIQMLTNIVINAVEAMPEGGIMKVKAKNEHLAYDNPPLPKGSYIRLSIKDHGTGIPQEHLSKIFDPYFSTKQRGTLKGMGLGLSIAYSIARKHDGHIWAESKPGGGATFHVLLPAFGEKAPEVRKQEGKPIPGSGKILIMDDEDLVRDIAGKILKYLGYEVKYSKEGEDAIEQFKKARKSGKPFDAVILDLTIPGGMGGKDAIEKLREIDKGIKAIISSGYSEDPIISNYRDYGFSGVVSKPYTTEQLSKVLHDVLSGEVR